MQLKSDTLLQGGKYKIEKMLGQGGFGITYQAFQTGLNRQVAIKEFFMKDYCERDEMTSNITMGTKGSRELVERFRQKFIKEAQIIAGLVHTHIISIYDVFEENGTAYYVMEYIDGGSLKDRIEANGAMSDSEALSYILQIADALEYLHDRRIMHLDVKPSNILLRDNGEAVLIDFGISKRYDNTGSQTSSTPIGISKGYAPLEQYKQGGVKIFSPSTDIYSLGATLFYLLTSQQPPEASDVNDEGLPALPIATNPLTVKAIQCAMQPRHKDRPQSIKEFLTILNIGHPSGIEEETIICPIPDNKTKKKDNLSQSYSQPYLFKKKWLWKIIIPSVTLGFIWLLIWVFGQPHSSPSTTIDSRDSLSASIMNNPITPTISTESQQISEQIIIDKKQRFIKYSDGTILDTISHLMWMTKDYFLIEGKYLKNGSWKEAMKWADKINKESYAGYNDWMVPSISEYRTICKDKADRHLYFSFFEDGNAYAYWSKNEISQYIKSYISFKDGFATSGDSEGQRNAITDELFNFSVRLVRKVK